MFFRKKKNLKQWFSLKFFPHSNSKMLLRKIASLHWAFYPTRLFPSYTCTHTHMVREKGYQTQDLDEKIQVPEFCTSHPAHWWIILEGSTNSKFLISPPPIIHFLRLPIWEVQVRQFICVELTQLVCDSDFLHDNDSAGI